MASERDVDYYMYYYPVGTIGEEWESRFDVVQGIAIAANTIIMTMLVIDFVLDHNRQYLTSHCILANTCVAHVLFAIFGVAIDWKPGLEPCVFLTSVFKVFELESILMLVCLPCNTLVDVIVSKAAVSRRKFIAWQFIILATWIISVALVFAIRVPHYVFIDDPTQFPCYLGPTWFAVGEIVFYTCLLLPHIVAILLPVTVLVFFCVKNKQALTGAEEELEMGYFTRKKQASVAIFCLVISLISLLTRIPILSAEFNAISQELLDQYLFYNLQLVYQLYYIIFPVVCFAFGLVRKCLNI